MNETASSPTKRLFIGFPVDVDSSLTSALKRTRISAERKGMEFYWVPESNYHVTLCFLGSTEVSRMPELESITKSVASASAPVKTSLRGMGGFPDERHTRVLYVGVRKSRALAELQGNLREALVQAGFEQEDRDYSPHLTVARTRKARASTDLLSPYVRTSFGDANVSSIVLFESLMHGSHPVYKPLAEFELIGEPVDFEMIEQSIPSDS